MDEQLLKLIRCPISFETLEFADESLLERVNRAIVEGGVRTSAGNPQLAPLESALVNASGQWLFSIHNDIPTMVPDEAIDLRSLSTSFEETSDEDG